MISHQNTICGHTQGSWLHKSTDCIRVVLTLSDDSPAYGRGVSQVAVHGATEMTQVWRRVWRSCSHRLCHLHSHHLLMSYRRLCGLSGRYTGKHMVTCWVKLTQCRNLCTTVQPAQFKAGHVAEMHGAVRARASGFASDAVCWSAAQSKVATTQVGVMLAFTSKTKHPPTFVWHMKKS